MNASSRLLVLASILATAASVACGGDSKPATDGGSDATAPKDGGGGKEASLPEASADDAGDDAGGDAAAVTFDPICTAAAVAPSGGSCITLTGDGGIECNPVTNAPCDADAGEACDFSSGGFHCYGPDPVPNTAALCATCDLQNGPACVGTETCLPTTNGNKCMRYCCTDGDCDTGHCDKATLQTDPVGICVK